MICHNPKCRHNETEHEWDVDTEVEIGGSCRHKNCGCLAFQMPCQIRGCLSNAVRIAVRFNSYTDSTKQERCRPKIKIRLCFDHRYLHGFAWVNQLDPVRRSRSSVVCQEIECERRGQLIEVHFRTHTDTTHKRQTRRSALICLCSEHRFIHGFSWTRKPFPFDSYGRFWHDLELFSTSRRSEKGDGKERRS